MTKNMDIFVATMTGTALMVADEIVELCSEEDIEAKITEMDYLSDKNLKDLINPVLIVSSTYGQGDVPDGSKDFYNSVKSNAPNLSHINYAIFGLGDMTYKDTFAYGGKKFDKLFFDLQAKRIGDPFYHDASDSSLPEEAAVNWFKEKILKEL